MFKQFKKDVVRDIYKIRTDISRKIHTEVEKLVRPDDTMLVTKLVMHCQNMALEKGQYVEFAPVPGMTSACKLTGNSLPVFEYRVFNKPMMEFILVRVEVARPDRISYFATVDSKYTQDPSAHGEEVAICADFMKPFEILAQHLYNYFPHYREPPHKVELCQSPPSSMDSSNDPECFSKLGNYPN